MSELPSLSFPSPLSLGGGANSRTRPASRGRGGRGRGHYTALELNDMDEIPLMGEEHHGGIHSDEGEEDEEEMGGAGWERLGGRKRWQQRMRSHSTLLGLICGGGWKVVLTNCLSAVVRVCTRRKEPKSRTVRLRHCDLTKKYPANKICNQKYNIITFLPKVFYEQFKFFINMYFLVVALTQFIPQLRIGYLYTYWAPLCFVFAVTILRELHDDAKRYLRDKDINKQRYYRLTTRGKEVVASSNIKVSDILIIEKNQRIPADLILLRTTERNGSCFIRTDQLDGETDWKLRIAAPLCQALPTDDALLDEEVEVFAEKPRKSIHEFVGTLSMGSDGDTKEDPLSIEHTLWSGTVLASGTAVGVVIYTGVETRSVMNTSSPRSKVGLVDLEINRLTKILFLATVLLGFVLLALKGFRGPWFIFLFRYIILFSYIIPISLRVNLDMGKLLYSWTIQRDKAIPDTLVRTSTIAEELGRVEYLLSDKTGTLTQNEMVFRKLHTGLACYSQETMNDVRVQIDQAFTEHAQIPAVMATPPSPFMHSLSTATPLNSANLLVESVKALALCHNVTPVEEEEGGASNGAPSHLQSSEEEEEEEEVLFENEESCRGKRMISYQASSPDEIALVKWTQYIGLTLVERDLRNIKLETRQGKLLEYEILQLFPFTSERKRMGIIVKEVSTGEITFYMKGADVVMTSIVQYNDWLEEECGNMAREGLRTLVVGRRILSEETYSTFETRYRQAKLSVSDRTVQVTTVMQSLEEDLELLCITGVEDQLQHNVRPTLELLRNAGVKVWMLTGDKLETATSIGLSSRLISRNQTIYSFQQVSTRSEAHTELNNFRKKSDSALIITGASLELCLTHYELEFVELACQCPAVVCCRCSPTHKAHIVQLLRTHTKKPVAAIGDGGNDVSMIQAANVGIGIVGKEGKQASLAADFSITEFGHISRLLVWHGRNSYKRSAALSQFVIHRGLIISVMQAVFCAMFYFAAVALYEGVLMVGYATLYTMAPVLSLVLDEDVSSDIALMYPELYQDLMKGRSLTFKTFFMWILISIYQGGVIMLVGLLLFEAQFIHVVAITFTALVLTELLMVALTIRTWHGLMLAAELFSIVVYITSLVVLKDYFDPSFLLTVDFVWKTAVITAASCIPLFIAKLMQRRCAPSSYSKLLKKNSMFRNCCKFTC